MKWEYIGTGIGLIAIGLTLMVALPPPWAPKMSPQLVNAGILGGLVLLLIGFGVSIIGVWPRFPENKIGPIFFLVIGALFVGTGGVWLYVKSTAPQNDGKLEAENSDLKLTLDRTTYGGRSTDDPDAVLVIGEVTVQNAGLMPSVATNWTMRVEYQGKTYIPKLIAPTGTLNLLGIDVGDGKPRNITYPPDDFIVKQTADPIAVGYMKQGYVFGIFRDLDREGQGAKVIITCTDVRGRKSEATQVMKAQPDLPMYRPKMKRTVEP
jgi:hypothetical protein